MTTSNAKGYLYARDFPNSVITESYRTLRANLLLSNLDADLRSIVITSPDRNEGKSTVCANLAIVMAQAEKKVLLIDCDLRLPTQHQLFELTIEKGLTRTLSSFGEDDALEMGDEVLPGLTVIGSGPPPPNPSELISSRRFRIFIGDMRDRYDAVIIDTPPVGLVSDAAVLSTMVDGAMLIVDMGRGRRNLALRAKKALERVHANILGVVMNSVRMERDYYPYTY